MKKPKNKHGRQLSKLIPKIRDIITKYTPQEETTFTLLFRPGIWEVAHGNVSKKDMDEFYSIETLQKKYKKINVQKIYHFNKRLYRKKIPIKSIMQTNIGIQWPKNT